MRTETMSRVFANVMATWRPPARQALSDWIEQNIFLPDAVSAQPGAVRLWPFQREIADAIGDPDIERVTLVKPVRVGFTTLLTGAIGSYVANDPAPILALLPTEADARDYMVSDIEPVFEASPALFGMIAGDRDENGRNTILSRRFLGGSLKVVAAKAPRNLRRHNVRILLCDEVDGMEATKEGPPVVLAERRTLSFADRKIIIGSTPLFEETSQVLRSYALSDARVFEVPCPDCGEFHEIHWSDIQWPEGDPAGACYVCPHCGSVVAERYKPQMVAGGRWRATRPEVAGHAGFRLNALVSLLANASWAKLAAEFLSAKGDPALLQVFVNTILAQGWREEGEALDENALAARAEAFSIEMLPEAVLAVTAGVDVQRDRLEATFVGWDAAGNAYVLGHAVVWGLPAEDETWRELDEMLKLRFPHPYGGTLGLDAAAIDSSDGETMERVYAFAFPRSARKIFAIKGVGGNRPYIERSKSKTAGGYLWIVGVDGIKSHLTMRLSRGQTVRFSSTLAPAWYEQLASERVVVRHVRGQPQRRFERIAGRAAEALDCTVYAFAVRQILNVNWDARAEELKNPLLAIPARPRPRVVRSNWMAN